MGNFSNNSITDKGRLLLADVQAGAVFTPTRIVIGAGVLPSTVTTRTITDVIAPIKSLPLNKKQRSNDGKCTFGGAYTNEDITAPFYFRELALYAKAVYLNEDGSVAREIAECLYSYGNAGDTADLMPAYSTSTVVEKQLDLVVWVGNDAQVDLIVESGIYVTHEDFDKHATRHAAGGEDEITPEMIGAVKAFGRYGGGGMEALDALTTTGNYSWLAPADNPFGAADGALFVVAVDCPNYGGNPVITQEITQVYAAGGSLPLGASFHRTIYDIWTSGWNKSYDTANLPTPPDIGALRLLTSKPHGIGFDHETAEVYLNIDGLNYTIPIGIGRYEVYHTNHKPTPAEIGAVPAVESTEHPGCYYRTVGGVVEWINPPTVPGVEYRTTKRHNGLPVYTKLVNYGNLLTASVDTGITGEIISFFGVSRWGSYRDTFPIFGVDGSLHASAYIQGRLIYVVGHANRDRLGEYTAQFIIEYTK